MPRTCWAPGCSSGYRSNADISRHLFSVPSNKCQEWSRKIPRQGQLTSKHYICDLHFEEQFLIKADNFIIDGQSVSSPRERWKLTPDAVPTLFPNLPTYLSTHISKRQPVKRAFIDGGAVCSKNKLKVSKPVSSELPRSKASADHSYASQMSSSSTPLWHKEKYLMSRRVRRQAAKIKSLNAMVRKLLREKKLLKQQLEQYQQLPDKMKMIVSQAAQNCDAKSVTGCRYSDEWIVDSLLIRCKSTSTYRLLRDGGFLPLPSLSTLNRSVRSLKPEFGFDSTLFNSLAQKLSAVDERERRGVLMFDEVQLSKNIEFRIDTCKLVGMVDFAEFTTDEQHYTEGDHALVFLFQPHLSSWIQTVGCFCSSGTTPAVVLSQLLLKCIILLENSGALVDGLVCDGASTNRSALASLGFNGNMNSLHFKMCNPCDVTRNIFFFCDVPHLLKTIRNNLLRAKEFMVICIFAQD